MLRIVDPSCGKNHKNIGHYQFDSTVQLVKQEDVRRRTRAHLLHHDDHFRLHALATHCECLHFPESGPTFDSSAGSVCSKGEDEYFLHNSNYCFFYRSHLHSYR